MAWQFAPEIRSLFETIYSLGELYNIFCPELLIIGHREQVVLDEGMLNICPVKGIWVKTNHIS